MESIRLVIKKAESDYPEFMSDEKLKYIIGMIEKCYKKDIETAYSDGIEAFKRSISDDKPYDSPQDYYNNKNK